MKKENIQQTIYTCDFCGATSFTASITIACEKRHATLALQEVCIHDFEYSIELGCRYESGYIEIYRNCKKCKKVEEKDIDEEIITQEELASFYNR